MGPADTVFVDRPKPNSSQTKTNDIQLPTDRTTAPIAINAPEKTDTATAAPESTTQLPALHQSFEKLSKNKVFAKAIDGSSIAAIISLFSAALFETKALGLPQAFVKPFSKFADLANRGFQLINSFRNITELLPKHDYLGVIGHFWDLVVPFTAKGENYFIARGLPLGQYVAARGMNIMNERKVFKSFDDYKSHLSVSWNKIKTNFFTNWRDIPKNLMNHKHAMFDILSGIFSTAGAVLWKPLESILGSVGRKIAVVLVDLGRFCQAFESMKVGHLRSGRHYMFASGYSQVLGAITHMLGETIFKPLKNVCDPLSFGFSALNRWFQSLSNERGEPGFKNA